MPTFDAEEMLDQIEGDKEHLSLLFETFTRVAVEQIDELHKAIEGRDSAALAAAAHCFKGSLGLFAAKPAVELAQRIESEARREDFDGAQAVLVKLEAECARLKGDLTTFLHPPD
jgi:HPt (histidine-containing phosphotransfer) domain-containing protein